MLGFKINKQYNLLKKLQIIQNFKITRIPDIIISLKSYNAFYQNGFTHFQKMFCNF